MLVQSMPYPASTPAPTPESHSYNYTGATEEVTVSAGFTSLAFKLWGAGGSGGRYSTGANGGPGGFTTGSFDVTSGDIIRIQVGQGGRPPADSTHAGAGGYPDGGGGSFGDTWGGGGGGSSRIWKNGVLMAVAGGGGACAGYDGHGGAGGGSSGTASSSPSGGGGTGGTQLAGGKDNSDTGNANKTGLQITSETNRTGGWGGSTGDITTGTGDDGGGGGGGYWGGGGGGGDGSSGGGGSGYLHASVTGTTTAGNPASGGGTPSTPVNSPAGTSDPDYPGGTIGVGSVSVGTFNTNPGGDGFAKVTVS